MSALTKLYANLLNALLAVPERGVAWFWHEAHAWRAHYPHTSDGCVRKVARQLLKLWSPDTSQKAGTAILKAWAHRGGDLQDDVLAAVYALVGQLHHCANPECQRPFIPERERESQKFCGRTECAVWAKRVSKN